MRSTYKIAWSDEALNNLKAIIQYLENTWTDKEVKKFARLLEQRILLLEANPFTFPFVNHPKQIRKVLITKHTSIFYQVVEGNIRLISLFDNRSNPDRIRDL